MAQRRGRAISSVAEGESDSPGKRPRREDLEDDSDVAGLVDEVDDSESKELVAVASNAAAAVEGKAGVREVQREDTCSPGCVALHNMVFPFAPAAIGFSGSGKRPDGKARVCEPSGPELAHATAMREAGFSGKYLAESRVSCKVALIVGCGCSSSCTAGCPCADELGKTVLRLRVTTP